MRASPSGSRSARFINTPIRRIRSPCCARALLRARRERPGSGSAAEQRDELATFQLIELHSVPSQGRIAGYRIGNGQSGGVAVRNSRRLGTPRAIIQIIPHHRAACARSRPGVSKRQLAVVRRRWAPVGRDGGHDGRGTVLQSRFKLGPPRSACGRNLVRDTCLPHPRAEHPSWAASPQNACGSRCQRA